ncbi:hypothetical protein V6Z12_A05G053500 [Gossypium hirsutum]
MLRKQGRTRWCSHLAGSWVADKSFLYDPFKQTNKLLFLPYKCNSSIITSNYHNCNSSIYIGNQGHHVKCTFPSIKVHSVPQKHHKHTSHQSTVTIIIVPIM